MTRSHWRSVGFALALGSLASANLFAQTETFTYDDLGRLVIVDHGDGKSTIYAFDGAGNRKNVQTSDGTNPTVPSNFVATPVSASQINLTWTASTDNVGVTGYRIERCIGSGCLTFLDIAATSAVVSYSDTALTDVTSYRYRIRATDALGNLSGVSTIASATTLDGVAPTAPSVLTATAISATQVNLTWAPSTDNVGVTGYRVERCTGAGCVNFAQIGTSASPTYSDATTTQVTTYVYRVRANDAASNLSAYSGSVSATTPDATAPTAPTGLSASAPTSAEVVLTWTAATDNVAVTSYRVERCTGTSCTTFAQIGTAAGTGYSDPIVAALTSYRYKVRAEDAAGNLGAYSSIASITTPNGPPTIPTNLQPDGGIITTHDFNITWNVSAGPVAYYTLQRLLPTTATFTITAPATSQAVTGTSYNTYSYQVQACNSSNQCSDWTVPSEFDVCLIPGGCNQ